MSIYSKVLICRLYLRRNRRDLVRLARKVGASPADSIKLPPSCHFAPGSPGIGGPRSRTIHDRSLFMMSPTATSARSKLLIGLSLIVFLVTEASAASSDTAAAANTILVLPPARPHLQNR